MMDDPMRRLDAEIHAQEQLLEGLKRARAICRGLSPERLLIERPPIDHMPEKPMPEKPGRGKNPKGKAHRAAKTEDFEDGKEGVMEVNGIDVPVTYRQNAMLELLNERQEACATKAELTRLCGGSGTKFTRALGDLNARLIPANATVVARKSKGYMLRDIA